MSHERQQIREAIKTQLIGALPGPTYATAAGARVYESRLAPIPTAQLPAISVYTADETVDPASYDTAPRELKRTVNVSIVGWVSTVANGAIEDALDALALQIETAMDSDLNLSTTAFTSGLLSTEIGISNDGNRPMGAVSLTYSIVYYTDIRVSAPVDELDTVDVRHSLDGAQDDEDDQAHDLEEEIY